MKTIVLKTRHILYLMIYCLLPLILFVLLYTPVKANTGSVRLIRDTILINKAQTSKKYKIKLYAGATNEVVFFTASGETGKVYQLFLFDLDGTLVKQTQIRNKQTTVLANFNKGNYMFEVFSDDERIENGTLVVR
jgi:hypothetical protein